MPPETTHHLITGTGSGIGNAIAKATLAADPNAHVIGISRRTSGTDRGLGGEERYTHFPADLAQFHDISAVALKIRKELAGKRLASMLHVAGFLSFDSEGEKNPSAARTMQALNGLAPKELTSALIDLLTEKAPVGIVSSLTAHPNTAFTPELRHYRDSKQEGVRRLLELSLNEGRRNPFIVHPGLFQTGMIDEQIKRPEAPLEWFAIPPEDPYQPGAIGDVVAKRILTPANRGPEVISRPRISGLCVSQLDPETQRDLLPYFVRMNIWRTLAMTDQTTDDHDARILHHQKRENYGPDFPYESLLAKNIPPAWKSMGEFNQRLLRAFRADR